MEVEEKMKEKSGALQGAPGSAISESGQGLKEVVKIDYEFPDHTRVQKEIALADIPEFPKNVPIVIYRDENTIHRITILSRDQLAAWIGERKVLTYDEYISLKKHALVFSEPQLEMTSGSIGLARIGASIYILKRYLGWHYIIDPVIEKMTLQTEDHFQDPKIAVKTDEIENELETIVIQNSTVKTANKEYTNIERVKIYCNNELIADIDATEDCKQTVKCSKIIKIKQTIDDLFKYKVVKVYT